jgi:phage repressor protein C with HTH and peptisase S24 domain
LAKEAGLTPTTVLRPYNATATTRLSQPTRDKLRSKFPEFPGWRNEHSDHFGMMGERPDPNERPEELVYIREVDIRLAMGDGQVIEDYPATQLVPFNLNFVRTFSSSPIERLLIMTGHGDSMEPTFLRSDLLMIDTSDREPKVGDQFWAFHYAGLGYVKRIRTVREDGRNRYELISDNKEVPNQTAEIEDVYIIGKVVWVGRRM